MKKLKLFTSIFFFLLSSLSFSQSTTKVDSLKKQLAILPQDTAYINTLNQLCKAYIRGNLDENVLNYAKQALSLSQKLGYILGEADAYLTQSAVFWERGDYKETISVATKALAIAEVHRFYEIESPALNNIALSYYELGDYDQAIIYYKKSIAIASPKNDWKNLGVIVCNLGNGYLQKGNYDSATFYFDESEKIALKINNLDIKAYAISSRSRLFSAQNKNELALATQHQALKILESIGGLLYISFSMKDVAELHLKEGRLDSTIYYAQKAFDLARKHPTKQRAMEASSLLAKAFYQKKDFKNAFDYQTISHIYKDSLFSLNSLWEISRLKGKYDNELREKELEKEKMQTYSIIVGLLLSLLASVLFFFQKIKNQKLEKQHFADELVIKKRELENQLVLILEKESFIEELKVQIELTKDKNTKTVLEDLQKMIEANLNDTENFTKFANLFNQLYPNFFAKLAHDFPLLSRKDKDLCAYIRMNLEPKKIADKIGIGSENIYVSRKRLAEKLGLSSTKELDSFIQQL